MTTSFIKVAQVKNLTPIHDGPLSINTTHFQFVSISFELRFDKCLASDHSSRSLWLPSAPSTIRSLLYYKNSPNGSLCFDPSSPIVKISGFVTFLLWFSIFLKLTLNLPLSHWMSCYSSRISGKVFLRASLVLFFQPGTWSVLIMLNSECL